MINRPLIFPSIQPIQHLAANGQGFEEFCLAFKHVIRNGRNFPKPSLKMKDSERTLFAKAGYDLE